MSKPTEKRIVTFHSPTIKRLSQTGELRERMDRTLRSLRRTHSFQDTYTALNPEDKNLLLREILQACGQWLEDTLIRDAANIYLLIKALKGGER